MRSLLHLISPALVLCLARDSIGQSKLPRLERVFIPALDSLGPEKSSATAAISLTGTIAFTGAFDERNRAVTIMDASGKVLARIGAPGQGPGELSVPMQVAFVGAELVVLELAARHLSRFGLDGHPA